MAPEVPGSLVILDLELKDSEVKCQVDRYDPTNKAIEPLKVSWNATECPPGYVSAGGGVVFVRRPPGYEHRTYPAKPDVLRDRFSWIDKVGGDPPELMLVIVLPTGYALPSVDEASPLPTVSKVFNSRMALYWSIAGKTVRRAEFSWRMERAETAEMINRSAVLNEETAARRPEQPILTSVIIDPPADKVQPNVLNAASQHEPLHSDPTVEAARITSRRGLVGGIITATIAALTAVSVGIINYCGNGRKSTPSPTTFIGRVVNKMNTGERIRSAKVSLEGESAPPLAYTDSEGIFSFPVTDPDKELRLRIEASQYENFDLRVIPSKNQGIQEIHLTPQTETKAELAGTVLDRNDRPIQGAQVTLDNIPGMSPVETSTDGVFLLKEIPKKYGESVRIRIVKEGYQPNPHTEDVVLGKAPPRVILTRKR